MIRCEAHLIDNIQFMRGLPDKAFYLGNPDPPYGIGESSANHKSRNTPDNFVVYNTYCIFTRNIVIKIMETGKRATGIYVNLTKEEDEKLKVLCARNSRKKTDQVRLLINTATQDIKLPGKKATLKK